MLEEFLETMARFFAETEHPDREIRDQEVEWIEEIGEAPLSDCEDAKES